MTTLSPSSQAGVIPPGYSATGIVDARQAAFLRDFRRSKERSRIIVALPTGDGREGMREVVELKAV